MQGVGDWLNTNYDCTFTSRLVMNFVTYSLCFISDKVRDLEISSIRSMQLCRLRLSAYRLWWMLER
jgi:hypothetical protein